MTAERTPLWRYIEECLDGRSWNWLGRQLGVSGNAVRNWASGSTPLKGYQADALAQAIGGSGDEIRALAGLSRKDEPSTSDRAAMIRQIRQIAETVGGFDHYTDDQLGRILALFEAASAKGRPLDSRA